MATQNSGSVRHHPAISEVAMTAVAQPLKMQAVAVAQAANGPGGGFGAGVGADAGPGAAAGVGVEAGMNVVAGASSAAMRPVAGSAGMRPVAGSMTLV